MARRRQSWDVTRQIAAIHRASMSMDTDKLYPLLDAQLLAIHLTRQALAANALTDQERNSLMAVRNNTLASLREILTILHPPPHNGKGSLQ